ncbi:unnamed protein product [Fraxinus pennsylvanica]|uniref:RING-type domain-containing protein n=1 Tax=Fraxinus pennsylvanica TaxID=56036 RepID=A0AAD1YQ30_9LAMI|nr:unnamed protein product [Fraxinus pennsylvanica]
MSTRESCQSIDGSNTFPAEYEDSKVHVNFMPARGDASAGYPMNTQGREAKNSSRTHISGNFPSLGFSHSILQHAEEINNDVKASPVQFGYPGNADGSFLTLGIGDNAEAMPNSNFNTQDVPSKMKETLSFPHNSFIQETLQSSSSLPPLTGRTVSSQTDAGVSSSLAQNLSCQNFVCNEAENIGGANVRQLNVIPSPCLQTPEADMQGTFPTNFNMHLGCQVDMAVSPLPCSSISIIHPDCTSVPALTSELHKLTLFARQSISNKKHNYFTRSSMKFSSDSSMNSHLFRHQGSSIRHAQLEENGIGIFTSTYLRGKLIPQSEGVPTRVVDTVPSPLNVKPMGKQIPLSEGCTPQVIDSIPFPGRVEPVGNLLKTQNYGSVDYPQKAVGPPLAIAQAYPCRLSNTTGQPQHGVLIQLSECANGQVIPVPKVDIQSPASNVSLKREANENSQSAPSSQHKRMIPQPSRHPSVPYQQRSIPAPVSARPPVTSSPLHIKWQAFDEPPKTIGQKCFLCKRDLSFTAEGPVYQPAVPPFVAVLPYGHTFHDHCLQTITPQDESKNPPCIPCAIGET